MVSDALHDHIAYTTGSGDVRTSQQDSKVKVKLAKRGTC